MATRSARRRARAGIVAVASLLMYFICVTVRRYPGYSAQRVGQAATRPWVFAGSTAASFGYMHLEVNGQLWNFRHTSSYPSPSSSPSSTLSSKEPGVSIVVDPLVGTLDFSLPQGFYSARPRILRNEQETIDRIVQQKPIGILLTQALDDHTHLPTLKLLKKRLFQNNPSPPIIIAPPSAKSRLLEVFNETELCILRPGTSVGLGPLLIRATPGSLVGPPWQDPENGYIVKWEGPSVYYEPHNDVDLDSKLLQGMEADIVIVPTKRQELPFLTLVHGEERAMALARHLKARHLIPLRNGEIEASGVLSSLVSSSTEGAGVAIFEQSGISIVENEPGKLVEIC